LKDPNSPLTPSSGERLSPLAPRGAGVLWFQVSGLAAVQGAITLSWVIYRLYLDKLLVQFGFTAALAATLLVTENLLAAFMEPLMGGLSDRAKRWVGTRFPFIIGGVILSSALFIAIPTMVIFGNPTSAVRWVFPIMLIAWAMAMTVFRSPVVSLLGQYAAPPALPQAMSLLTLSGGLMGAFAPIANKIILGWGPAVTFALGSFVLLGATAVLRFVHPPEAPTLSSQNPNSSSLPVANSLLLSLGLIFITGAGVAWGTSFLMQTLRQVMQGWFGNDNINSVMLVLGIALAIAALPAGAVAVKVSNGRAMLWGIGLTVGLILLIALVPNFAIAMAAVAAIVGTFSLISNGAVPYALSIVPPQRAGLGTGMYFGGFSAAAGLFGLVFRQPNQMTPMMGAVLGAIAFLIAGLCIAASTRKSTAAA
jgi:predicted MFS family arabinose efflux permease